MTIRGLLLYLRKSETMGCDRGTIFIYVPEALPLYHEAARNAHADVTEIVRSIKVVAMRGFVFLHPADNVADYQRDY